MSNFASSLTEVASVRWNVDTIRLGLRNHSIRMYIWKMLILCYPNRLQRQRKNILPGRQVLRRISCSLEPRKYKNQLME